MPIRRQPAFPSVPGYRHQFPYWCAAHTLSAVIKVKYREQQPARSISGFLGCLRASRQSPRSLVDGIDGTFRSLPPGTRHAGAGSRPRHLRQEAPGRSIITLPPRSIGTVPSPLGRHRAASVPASLVGRRYRPPYFLPDYMLCRAPISFEVAAADISKNN